jgi:hypothetical protein
MEYVTLLTDQLEIITFKQISVTTNQNGVLMLGHFLNLRLIGRKSVLLHTLFCTQKFPQ